MEDKIPCPRYLMAVHTEGLRTVYHCTRTAPLQSLLFMASQDTVIIAPLTLLSPFRQSGRVDSSLRPLPHGVPATMLPIVMMSLHISSEPSLKLAGSVISHSELSKPAMSFGRPQGRDHGGLSHQRGPCHQGVSTKDSPPRILRHERSARPKIDISRKNTRHERCFRHEWFCECPARSRRTASV